MPTQKRHKTRYQGVNYISGIDPRSGKPERIYYIRYRRNGKLVEEKAGRQHIDAMTPARAAQIRARRMAGDEPSNTEKRAVEATKRKAEADKWTIARLWEAYKENRPNLKGIVTDQNRFDNYINPNFGKKEPQELIPLDVDRLRLKLLKKRSPATVRNVLELLRRIINFGVNKQLCVRTNFKIEMPPVDNEVTEDLTPEQLKALLQAIAEDIHHNAGDMMLMALYTGVRRGEMFRLQWKHVDFERGFIKLVDPKGGKDQVVPMNDATRQVLESRHRDKSPYVFPGRDGGQLTDIKKSVNQIKQAAGLPKQFRALHGLRHVYASMLASSGQVDMFTLQKLLTHKSPVMTARYGHLRDEALKKASNVAGDIISQASKEAKADKGKVVDLKR